MIHFADNFVAVEKGDHVKIAVADPRQCSCGRMVCFLVNRDGKTRCLECDEKYLREGSCRTLAKS
jgi:hypothetical protein